MVAVAPPCREKASLSRRHSYKWPTGPKVNIIIFHWTVSSIWLISKIPDDNEIVFSDWVLRFVQLKYNCISNWEYRVWVSESVHCRDLRHNTTQQPIFIWFFCIYWEWCRQRWRQQQHRHEWLGLGKHTRSLVAQQRINVIKLTLLQSKAIETSAVAITEASHNLITWKSISSYFITFDTMSVRISFFIFRFSRTQFFQCYSHFTLEPNRLLLLLLFDRTSKDDIK